MPFEALVRKTGERGAHGSLAVGRDLVGAAFLLGWTESGLQDC